MAQQLEQFGVQCMAKGHFDMLIAWVGNQIFQAENDTLYQLSHSHKYIFPVSVILGHLFIFQIGLVLISCLMASWFIPSWPHYHIRELGSSDWSLQCLLGKGIFNIQVLALPHESVLEYSQNIHITLYKNKSSCAKVRDHPDLASCFL